MSSVSALNEPGVEVGALTIDDIGVNTQWAADRVKALESASAPHQFTERQIFLAANNSGATVPETIRPQATFLASPC